MHRWARLRLPCGQIARTAWRESERPLEKLRIARHVKVIIDEAVRFAEIQYFTQVAIPTDNVGEWHDANIAVVSVFSAPDADLVQLSNQTVLSCKYLGDEGLCVVDVTSIKSVVAMIPHRPTLPSGIIEDRFFVLERPGLDIFHFGVEQDQEDEADQREIEAEERN
ncbi:hypothetical protein EDD22DRAFT_816757 [Suillus occidentalis]|nr:hypothetical protein EDD22DRAFT_816757 [Suillus occidentalis]